MAQGIFGGATSYEEQSLMDIVEDLDKWTEYAHHINDYLSECLANLKKSRFWEKIPTDFQMTIITTISYCDTITNDIRLVKNAIQKDQVTNREVKLLSKIGYNSINFNNEYGRTYKNYDRWKDYDNPDFRVAEKAYAKGRDFFVTLQDAGNAAERLKDYMDEGIIKNNINIGGNVVNSPIQQGQNNTMNVSNNTIDMSKLNQILSDVLQYSDDLSKEQVKESIEAIQEEVQKTNPKKSIIKIALTGLKALKGTAEFAAAVATLASLIAPIL